MLNKQWRDGFTVGLFGMMGFDALVDAIIKLIKPNPNMASLSLDCVIMLLSAVIATVVLMKPSASCKCSNTG